MTKNQAYNIFYYLGIMLIDNKIINTSPDYLIEKTMIFFNKLGKNEFKGKNNNIYGSQKIDFSDEFWLKYCKMWNIDMDEYEIYNIINFILNSNINDGTSVMKNFKKYIGDFDVVSDSNLSFTIHPKLLSHINNSIDINNRYLKLLLIPVNK